MRGRRALLIGVIGGGDPTPPPPVDPAPTGINGSLSIAYDAAEDDVAGTLTVVDPGGTSWSGWALAGADAAKFKLSATTGSSVQVLRSGTGTLTAGIPASISVSVTDNGGNTLAGVAKSVSVTDPTAETLIGILTVTEGSGAVGTDEMFNLFLPIGPGVVDSGETITIYDDDGTGAQGLLLANYQVENLAVSLTGEMRGAAIAGIIPAIASGASRKLRLYASTTPPPSGTAITDADIAALGCMANGGVVIEQVISGTTWAAFLATAIAGGATFTKSGAVKQGAWRSGPCFVERIYSAPLTNGGSAHASGDGLRAEFHVKARKADVGAVSGGNPILGLEVRAVIRNGHRAAASEYSISTGRVRRATSLTDPTLLHTDDTDLDSNTITNDFTSSYTTWAGAGWSRMVIIGPRPKLFAAMGDCGNAKTPINSATFDYLSDAARVLSPVSRGFSDVNHSAHIARLNGTPTTKPLQHNGVEAMGNIELAEDGTGDRQDIGIIPGWYVNALLKLNGDGRRLIFRNAEFLASQASVAWGLDYASTTKRFWNLGDTFPTPFAESASDPWIYDLAHESDRGWLPYILTGDYYWFSNLVAASSQSGGNGYNGTGINFTAFGAFNQGGLMIDQFTGDGTYHWTSGQMRGVAWESRRVAQVAYVVPAARTAHDLLSPSRASREQHLTRGWARARAVIEAQTGPSSTYHRYGAGNAPRYTHPGGDPLWAPWQLGHVCQSFGFGKAIGVGNADLDVLLEWVADWFRGWAADTSISRDYGLISAYYVDCALTDTTRIITRADALLQARRRSSGELTTERWFAAPSAALSATSGAAVTVTLSSGILTPAQAAWYAAGYFMEHPAPNSIGGRGRITAVLASNLLTIDTTAADGNPFSTTTLPSGQWSIPAPHLVDAPPDRSRPIVDAGFGGANSNYVDIARTAVAMLKNAGVTGLDDAYNYLAAWKPAVNASNPQFDWRPR